MSRISTCVMAVFLLLFPAVSSGHHPSGGPGAGGAGPITTVSATPLPKGKVMVSAEAEYINIDSFSDSELREFADSGKDAHSFDSLLHVFLSAGFGLTDNLSFGFRIPYVEVNNINEAHADEPDEVHRHGDAHGIGDLTVIGQYRFLNMPEARLDSALLFGIKVPTGTTEDKDVEGVRFETEHQPGSGSWDPMIGAAVTKRLDSLSLDASLLYTFATEGAQDTDLGDRLAYNAALSYRPLAAATTVDLILEMNGEWQAKQEISGEEDENSGGNVIFVSPGVRLSFGNWIANLSVGVPVEQDWNGTQTDISYRARFGIGLYL